MLSGFGPLDRVNPDTCTFHAQNVYFYPISKSETTVEKAETGLSENIYCSDLLELLPRNK